MSEPIGMAICMFCDATFRYPMTTPTAGRDFLERHAPLCKGKVFDA